MYHLHPIFNPERLGALLSERLQQSIKVIFTKCLSDGHSGSRVCLVELHAQPAISFAVVKVAGKGKNEDLVREFEAMKNIREKWPHDVLPDQCELFTDSSLVNGFPDAAVLVTSFAHLTETKVQTFRELLIEDVCSGNDTIKKVMAFYKELVLSQPDQGNPPVTAREYFLEMLGDNLVGKIKSCDWMALSNILASDTGLIVGDQVLPNAAHVFQNPDIWNKDCFSAPRIMLHGDLNIDNLIIRPDGKIVFIDFEKFRNGLVYWDISFLFMWIAQLVLLDGKHLSISDLEKLILQVAQPLDIHERKQAFPLGCKVEPFGVFARDNLFLLGTTDDPVTPNLPPPNRRKAAALGIAAAALARAFYQFRASANCTNTHDQAEKKINGLFFYALSCAALKRSEALENPYLNGRHISEIENQIMGPTNRLPKQNLSSNPEIFQSALKLPIQSLEKESPAIFVKLVFEVPLELNQFDLKGWKRIIHFGPYGYLSKLNIKTDYRLREATENIFHWENSVDGAMPVIYGIEDHVMGKAWHVVHNSFQLTLCHIDLIPLVRGTAMMGFLFKRESCLVEDYLKFVSYRNHGKLLLSPAKVHVDGKSSNMNVGGLRKELTNAIMDDRHPKPENVEMVHSDPDYPKVFQNILWPNLDMAIQPIDGSVQGLAAALLATLSRPKKDYPKDKPGSISFWGHPSSLGSLYFLTDKAFTLISDPESEFNRNNKVDVFMQSNYLLWIMARELSMQSGESGDILLKCFDEDLRREIFRQCLQFHRK